MKYEPESTCLKGTMLEDCQKVPRVTTEHNKGQWVCAGPCGTKNVGVDKHFSLNIQDFHYESNLLQGRDWNGSNQWMWQLGPPLYEQIQAVCIAHLFITLVLSSEDE